MFTEMRSPVPVVVDPGVQSRFSRLPVVRAVEVDAMYCAVPVVKALAKVLWTVPVAVEFAVKVKSPAFAVEV